MTNDHSVQNIKDVRLYNDIVFQLLDHKHKRVEVMVKVGFPASEIQENSEEIDGRITAGLNYLKKEGFFLDIDMNTVGDYDVVVHFFHDIRKYV